MRDELHLTLALVAVGVLFALVGLVIARDAAVFAGLGVSAVSGAAFLGTRIPKPAPPNPPHPGRRVA